MSKPLSISVVTDVKSRTLGATLLVTGCCIGAGMIGLPITSLLTGFIPTIAAMLLSYLFTTSAGLLLLEATLWFDQKVNLLSIADFALGKKGKLLAGTLFLLLFYSIFIAYMDGGGQLFAAFLGAILGFPLSREIGIFVCVAFVMAIVYFGTQVVDKINRALMIGLIASYFALVLIGAQHVVKDNLLHANWKASIATLPILFICFGFQNLVPSLTHYLKRNVQALRFAIIGGNFIALLFYLVWEFVLLGILPHDSCVKSNMIGNLLQKTSSSSSVQLIVNAFTFFALVTSFLAIAVSFVDFFKDGLKSSPSSRRRTHEILIYGLVFAPPLIFSLAYPNLFLKALDFAGGIIDVVLFGILPALIVWSGRYIRKAQGPYLVKGGKIFVGFIFFLSIAFLLLQVF
jgi:tyrosine-specific transport protein